jgi:hypothetical protein
MTRNIDRDDADKGYLRGPQPARWKMVFVGLCILLIAACVFNLPVLVAN